MIMYGHNIGIIVNDNKDPGYVSTRKVIECISRSDYTAILDERLSDKLSDQKECEFVKYDELFKLSKIVITLGGDGTLLGAAYDAVKNYVSLLGINLGNLGYLAQLEFNDIDKLPNLLKSGLSYQSRMMLKMTIVRNGKALHTYPALNDIVVTRGAVLRPITVDLGNDNRKITSYYCDGLIFSTPPGSTAYSMSVGGPILDPQMEAILVSAISPHSISSHSLVFDASTQLTCSVQDPQKYRALVSVDGRRAFALEDSDIIRIEKYEQKLSLVKISESDFYTILKNKFSGR